MLKLAGLHASHPGRMLLFVLLLTVLFGWFAEHLKVTMRWSDLLPSHDRRTIQFNKIIDEFASATSLVVVVQGEEKRIKEFADALAPRILETSYTRKDDSQLQLYRRVDYKTELEFLKEHGLMLLKEDDLKNLQEIFTDPNLTGLLVNLNNAMEKEYVGQEESISTREKEDQAVMFLDGIQDLVEKLQQAAQNQNPSELEIREVADKLLFGEPFFLSYDEKALVMNAVPNFSMVDTELLVGGTDAVQVIIDAMKADFPDVNAGLTGFIAIGRDEMVYSAQSLSYTTVIALIAILTLLIFSFRMWVAPLLAILNLLVGLIWAIGATALIVGQLNIMTSMMAVILLGLGIDFSIHIISGFTERRAAGDSIKKAMEETFIKNGKGVVTGALTTACAFLTLMISQSRGMKEMGIVTGLGLLAILLTTFLFLPSVLVLREKRIDRKAARTGKAELRVQRDITFRFLGRTAEWLGRRYVFTLLAAVVITLLLIWAGSGITFDHNYLNIEPEGLESIVLQDVVLDKFDMGMDYALILTDNVDQSRDFAQKYRDLGSVAATEDISLYLPSPAQQRERIPYINQIRELMQAAVLKPQVKTNELDILLDEVQRLEMNVMEMQDMAFLGGQDKVDNKCQQIVGDPDNPDGTNLIRDLLSLIKADKAGTVQGFSAFNQSFGPHYKASVLQMCSEGAITQEQLPESILDRYSNVGRDQFLVTVFPSGSVWKDAQFLKRFATDLEDVSERATGMPPVFRALIEVIGRDGKNAALLTIAIVFLLLWLDFRHPGYALMALVPLVFGVCWMVGLMHLSGMQLTVMNVMGLPLIIGIGIDDGVHIVHRLRQEGRGKLMTIFASTGKAILLTSLTTMLAFGSLVFSVWRGFGHLGGALFLGVGACFLTTVIFLAGIIGWRDRRR